MSHPEDTSTNDDPANISANPGYALGQLARAFKTIQSHADPETRARAEQKLERWITVFQGMLSGALQVGSRTPVASAPAWATLEVLKGGFTTGALLAGGPLLAHEQALLETLPNVPAGAERTAITSYYLSDAGLAALRQMLTSGCYRIDVPEEGALLVVAWLLGHEHIDQARALLDALGAYIGQLRFYPAPAARPLTTSALVHRQTVGEVVRELQALRVPSKIVVEREAVTIWAPLYDQVVALFAETVSGPLPALSIGPHGELLRSPGGSPIIEGGWPCQHYADDWPARAQAVLEAYRQLRAAHPQGAKPDRASENFPILRAYLEQCASDPTALTGRDVGRIRAILAAVAAKRGLPDSARCQALRHAQRERAARLTSAELAPALIDRLATLPQDTGLTAVDELLAPVADEQAARLGLPVGQLIPAKLSLKLQHCVDAPVEALIAQGVIPSGEVLARVIPQITAQISAAGIADADLRRLYGTIYAAFRQRRSLLLLNLEHQVRLRELPWIAAIDAFRANDQQARAQARQTLEQVAALALGGFPHQIVPNKLLQEIRALSERAELAMPIVDEVAADIFMGTFSEKYVRAAQRAGELLAGTLYERYYGIDYAQVQQIDDLAPSQYGAPTSAAFTELCYARAGVAQSGARSVARNGMVIEQEQILTTHNLAVLVQELGLREGLRLQLDDLARGCFTWICRRQQQKIDTWQPRLRMIKNSAYAWRQMVFFLALLPSDSLDAFLGWAYEHLSQQRPAFQTVFRPALDALALVARGGSLDVPDLQDDARRFLGWATERHWLMRDS